MDVGNGEIGIARFEVCQEVGCKYHKKEARYSIKVFPESEIIIVECLECKPPALIVKAAINMKRKV